MPKSHWTYLIHLQILLLPKHASLVNLSGQLFGQSTVCFKGISMKYDSTCFMNMPQFYLMKYVDSYVKNLPFSFLILLVVYWFNHTSLLLVDLY